MIVISLLSYYILGESYNSWSSLLISGWGTTSPHSISLPGVLQKAKVSSVSQRTCEEVMGKTVIKPGMICAAGPGTDTCQVLVMVRSSYYPS